MDSNHHNVLPLAQVAGQGANPAPPAGTPVGIELLQYQTLAVDWLATRGRAFVIAPAGSGKTIIAAAGLARVVFKRARTRKPRVGWLANTREQCEQAHAAVAKFAGLADAIELTVACPSGMPAGAVFDALVVDEAHHATARTWAAIIRRHTGALWGFSATPRGDDKERNRRLYAMFDRAFHRVPRSAVAERVLPADVIFLNETDDGVHWMIDEEIKARIDAWGPESWEESLKLYRNFCFPVCQAIGILPNERRNEAIARVCHMHAEDSTLVLVHTIEHGQRLAERIPGAHFAHSKMGARLRRETIAAFKAGEIRCLVATSLADEGFDCPIASVLVMAGAGRSASRAEQRTGRVLRAAPGKTRGRIYDFVDRQHRILHNQSKSRGRTYRQLGYRIFMAPTPAFL